MSKPTLKEEAIFFQELCRTQKKELDGCYRRIRAALKILKDYGWIDGAHHKQWVIDQTMRKLMGMADYKRFAQKTNCDEGIAP